MINEVLLKTQLTKWFVAIDPLAQFTAFLTSDTVASIADVIPPINGCWVAQ